MADPWPFQFTLPPPLPKDATPLTAEQAEQELLKQLETHRRAEKQILWDLAVLYSRTGRQEEAFARVQRVVEITETAEEKGKCHLTMGQLMEQMRHFEMAIRHYSRALFLEPADDRVWYLIHNNLGYCLNHFGRFDEAEFYCRKAIEIDPTRQNAYKNLGIALEGQGDYASAAMCYIRAVQTNASDARSLRHLESLADKHPVVSVDVPEFDMQLQACREAVAHATQACIEALEQQKRDLSPVSTDKRPSRILCLDDEPSPLQSFKCVLEPLGYEVLTTLSSTEALRIMRTEPVDLLIQDIARPDINGIELYGIMKSDERLQNIPVVVHSGFEGNRKRFLERYPEVAAVIAKPYQVDHLLEVIRKALRSSQ